MSWVAFRLEEILFGNEARDSVWRWGYSKPGEARTVLMLHNIRSRLHTF